MCGRFVLTADSNTIQQAFNLDSVPAAMQPRYNIAPTQPVAVITNEAPKTLTFYKWGLVPSWSKDATAGARMINARSESAAEKPSFRAAFRRRRCIIPSDGYYEWPEQDSTKTPIYFHREGRALFGMAGLWEIWQQPDGGELRTCSILTTDANGFAQQFHHRMPVILSPDDYNLWLSPKEEPLAVLQALMKPYPGDEFRAYPVSKAVNKPVNDYASLLEPVQPMQPLL